MRAARRLLALLAGSLGLSATVLATEPGTNLRRPPAAAPAAAREAERASREAEARAGLTRLEQLLSRFEDPRDRAARVDEQAFLEDLARLQAVTRRDFPEIHADVRRLQQEYFRRRNWDRAWRSSPAARSDGHQPLQGAAFVRR